MEGFYQQVMDLVRTEKDKRGSYRALCSPLGLNVTTVSKWFTERFGDAPRSPNLLDVAKIMDSIGVIVRPAENVLTEMGEGDVEHALEMKQVVEENTHLKEENEQLKLEVAKLKGQVELLREIAIVPLVKPVANLKG